jgi:hypothetical protein
MHPNDILKGSSFLRKQESSIFRFWIPVFTGMTTTEGTFFEKLK